MLDFICIDFNLVFTLYAYLIARDLPAPERIKYGIRDNLIRFSLGIEDFEDLKEDISQALEKI